MDRQEDSQNLEQGLETGPGREERHDPSRPNAIEGLYEYFREVPLKALDIFIWICLAVLVAAVAVGVLKAKGS